MHVADHALSGRDLVRELMLDGMTRLVLGDLCVGGLGESLVPCGRVRTRSSLARVVRINDVTRRTACGAIVAGLVIRPEVIERRIQKTCLLQAEVNGIRAVIRAESTGAEAFVRLTRLLVLIWVADLEASLTAALEDAKDIPGLRYLPPRERLQ
jgi:hypothetical protein